MKDLISIIVSVYQVELYLDQCIQSILNQTYKNIEIILVVDNGTNDKCPQICEHYAKIDKRIKIIYKENGSLDAARKAGMMAAAGKYVGYVDGDDWIEPIMYEKLLEYAHIYDVDIVESGAIDSSIDNEKNRTPYLAEGCYKGKDFAEIVEPKLLYAGVFFEHGLTPYMWSKLFLKEKIEKFQMMPGLTNILYDDIMVSLPCIAESKSLYISHGCYYHYRVRSDSAKRKFRQDEAENLIKCYHDFYTKFKGTKLCSKDDKQIKYYALYWLLFRAPYAFDNPNDTVFLTQFGSLEIKSKIVLYGAGAAGIHLENYIQQVKGSNIVCWADRNYEDLQRTLDVKNPKEIVKFEYDYVIISILRESAVQSAKRDLIELNIPAEKILWIKQEYLDNPELLLRKVKNQDSTLV